jgi:hypothetical protein
MNPNIQDLQDQITFNHQLINQVNNKANTSLSNLTTTNINQDLIPNNNTLSIGNNTNYWNKIHTNFITNTLTSPIAYIDTEKINAGTFLRYKRPDLTRAFAINCDGIGLRFSFCRDLLFTHVPQTSYDNIGLYTSDPDIKAVFGFNNNKVLVTMPDTKVLINTNTTFSGSNTPALLHVIPKNENTLDAYSLFQSITTPEYRGGILLATSSSSTEKSIKLATTGTTNTLSFIIANVNNNSPDTINTKIIEAFGNNTTHTNSPNISIGDQNNKGIINLWIDKSNFNTATGKGILHIGNASTLPTNNPITNTIYTFVHDNSLKIKTPDGFIITV